MSFPYRRNPRLKNHDYTTPGAYFITICTKNRQQLLWEPLLVGRDDEDRKRSCARRPPA